MTSGFLKQGLALGLFLLTSIAGAQSDPSRLEHAIPVWVEPLEQAPSRPLADGSWLQWVTLRPRSPEPSAAPETSDATEPTTHQPAPYLSGVTPAPDRFRPPTFWRDVAARREAMGGANATELEGRAEAPEVSGVTETSQASVGRWVTQVRVGTPIAVGATVGLLLIGPSFRPLQGPRGVLLSWSFGLGGAELALGYTGIRIDDLLRVGFRAHVYASGGVPVFARRDQRYLGVGGELWVRGLAGVLVDLRRRLDQEGIDADNRRPYRIDLGLALTPDGIGQLIQILRGGSSAGLASDER